jgi:hypothetical protein
MRHLTAALAPLAVLGALAGCAGQADMEAPAAPDTARYRGTWIVTDAFPSGAVADPASAPRGQPVPMEAARAGDPAGRICLTPAYAEERAPLASVLGAAAADWPGLGESVPVLVVRCGTAAFASYAMTGDGVLMTRYGGWLLRLEHGERLAAKPAPMVADAAAAAVPPPAPPPAASPAPAAAETPRRLVYLASYKTEDWARKGWGILAARSAALKASQPVTRTVDLKDKGRFVRLFAGAGDEAAAKAICRELGKAIAECGAAGRE